MTGSSYLEDLSRSFTASPNSPVHRGTALLLILPLFIEIEQQLLLRLLLMKLQQDSGRKEKAGECLTGEESLYKILAQLDLPKDASLLVCATNWWMEIKINFNLNQLSSHLYSALRLFLCSLLNKSLNTDRFPTYQHTTSGLNPFSRCQLFICLTKPHLILMFWNSRKRLHRLQQTVKYLLHLIDW